MNNKLTEKMTKKLVEITFCEDHEKVVNWLHKILSQGGGFAEIDYYKTIVCYNKDINYRCGFSFHSDPITKAVMIASVVAGASNWMFSFPNLLKEINKKWKSQK